MVDGRWIEGEGLGSSPVALPSLCKIPGSSFEVRALKQQALGDDLLCLDPTLGSSRTSGKSQGASPGEHASFPLRSSQVCTTRIDDSFRDKPRSSLCTGPGRRRAVHNNPDNPGTTTKTPPKQRRSPLLVSSTVRIYRTASKNRSMAF